LERTFELLHTEPKEYNDPQDQLKAMSIVASTARTVLATQIKVDEHALKRKQLDKMPELLARLEEKRRKNALIEASELVVE
jgi:hypothetical protein